MASSSSLGHTSQWNCRACTYLNNEPAKVCDICQTPKATTSTLGSVSNDAVAAAYNHDGNEDVYHHVVETVDIDDGDDEGIADDVDKKGKKRMKMSREMKGQPIMPDGAPRKGKSAEDRKAVTSVVPDDGSSANDMLRQLHLERVGRRKQAQGTSYTLCHSFEHMHRYIIQRIKKV